jgi:hypothetical protein
MPYGTDVFMEAVRGGDMKAVQQMLDNKIVHADDTTGTQTPLLVSSSRGKLCRNASEHTMCALMCVCIFLYWFNHTCIWGAV